ncbi:MAG: EF-hand domain-containing protein [Ardenticatenaceae bacterium]|nr:EF-hand domain-containing protein [Ardenticatenaceae bacterium]MCB8947676.1 EF-hand domain-containing protein [Ardenticatenaceae bacterium]
MASELQQKKWANMFNMFDVNGDGKIEQADFDLFHSRLYEMRGIGPGDAQFDELNGRFAGFAQALQQMTQSESVGMDDWINFLSGVANAPQKYQIVRPISEAIFGLWDLNGDGHVSLSEYRKLCTVMRLGEEYADQIFTKLDLNQDQRITVDELITLSDEFFVGDDPAAPGNLFFGPLN